MHPCLMPRGCGLPAACISVTHDGGRSWPTYADGVTTTYAVKWREPDGETYLGRLALGSEGLDLAGRAPHGPAIERRIAYDELDGLRVGQLDADRLDGEPALVLERGASTYRVASTVVRAGILQELVHRLSELRLAAPRCVTIVVPLEEGSIERVRELAAAGPPFEPDTTDLSRHQLLLTPREAIFVFEMRSAAGLEVLLGQLDVWAAAASSQDVVAGPPRLAEIAYTWERPQPQPLRAAGFGY